MCFAFLSRGSGRIVHAIDCKKYGAAEAEADACIHKRNENKNKFVASAKIVNVRELCCCAYSPSLPLSLALCFCIGADNCVRRTWILERGALRALSRAATCKTVHFFGFFG